VPFVGDKGSATFPKIKRVDLISGEQYMREGRGLRAPRPAGTAGIGVRHIPSPGSPREFATHDTGNSHWLEQMVRTPIAVWTNGGTISLTSVNKYGLVSRSEMLYPELYRPIDTKFWQPLTPEERAEIVARAAAANARATFDDEQYRPVAATSADEAYADAQSRRSEALRRRKKPRNYDERKKEEELQRKMPLVRRYTGPAESFYRSSSAIVKTSPLDTPILADGLPVFGAQNNEPAPKKLKAKQRTVRRPMASSINYDSDGKLVAPAGELPTFSPLAGKRTRLIEFTNNPWGLKSWSEMLFPEAYRDISNVYWKQLSDEERQRIMAVQARAMEKVGYEPGTPKMFIQPIEPDDDYRVRRGGRTDDTAGQRGGSGEGFIVLLVVLAILAALLYYGGSAINGAQQTGVAAHGSATAGDGGD